MQSREDLLTPVLKYFALAWAQVVLGKFTGGKWWRCIEDAVRCVVCGGLSNWPHSSSQSPQFGLSFGGRWRVIEDPLNLEFYLPGAQEPAGLVHPEVKVAALMVYCYILTVLPMLQSVLKEGRVQILC